MDSTYDGNIKELDAHNLHGLLESYTTAEWFKDKNQRPFIISRSTFSGSGKYSGHWTGDNFSDYNFMRFSIHSIMHFNFFGIPFTGADVCGFNGNATASLCARWYKLAVFYPFARNHNNLETDPQEPYYSEFNVTVDFTYKKTAQEIIKNAFYTRYGLHVYFYTQFHKASTDGVPVIRPLFFNYPNDTQVYDDYVSNNIMIGDSVRMSSDISDVDRDQYYFPEKGAQWCPIWEGVYMQCFTGGSWQNIAIPISEIMLHFRSGSILSIQLSDSNMFANITNIFSLDDLATKYRTDLAILLDGDLKASGDVRFDGGVTTDLTKYDEIKFSALGTKPFFGSKNFMFFINNLHF